MGVPVSRRAVSLGIGLVFLAPFFGTAAGALAAGATGAGVGGLLGRLLDPGVPQGLSILRQVLEPGHSILILELPYFRLKAVLPNLSGQLLYTNLDGVLRERIEDALETPEKEAADIRETDQPCLWSSARRVHRRWGQNGLLSLHQIEVALRAPDLPPEEQAALETLRGHQFSSGDQGITMADIDTMESAGGQTTQIMVEQFDLEYTLATVPDIQVDPLEPADLTHKIGTRDFYKGRYIDFRRRNPDEAAPCYYLYYGLKYFDRFHQQKVGKSQRAQNWIDRTGINLQVAIENRRAANGTDFANLERDRFKCFAYATHATAYNNAGLSNVPMLELLGVPFIPDVEDIMTARGIKQILETAITFRWARFFTRAGADAVKMTWIWFRARAANASLARRTVLPT